MAKPSKLAVAWSSFDEIMDSCFLKAFWFIWYRWFKEVSTVNLRFKILLLIMAIKVEQKSYPTWTNSELFTYWSSSTGLRF